MPRVKKILIHTEEANIDAYKHKEKRVRIPTQEESDKISAKDKQVKRRSYSYDPSLDPQLVWSGKEEQGGEFSVPTVPIYVQEQISPEAIIARLKQNAIEEEILQPGLFGGTAQGQIDGAVDFYKHEGNWKNRMILGDSLTVMNSLLEKEGMRGMVQCIYIDPPYGIKFGSNWQVSTRKRDVKDNKVDDLVRQPEQVKAFRDTWELGIHSYLSYLRDRLIVARELIGESGSCFLQINDENVHLVRSLMDEVFGSSNFVSQITYSTTSGIPGNTLSRAGDNIIWYAKDITRIKYRQLFTDKGDSNIDHYGLLLLQDGSVRSASKGERESGLYPEGSCLATSQSIISQGSSEDVQWLELNNSKFRPPVGQHWKTTIEGIKTLYKKGRILIQGNSLRYLRLKNDFPINAITNMWGDTSGELNKKYVVQTGLLVIQRCILMSTDPGDIVLDPTCGSGTTAYLAEEWGRRWITTDTSRVALALARTRLMTAKFAYYRLKDSIEKDIRMGFQYKTVPHITLKSLANNEPSGEEILYDQPLEQKDLVRVSGPFTVESLAPHKVEQGTNELLASDRFVETIVDNMRRTGIQVFGEKSMRVQFENLDIIPAGPEIQAIGEYITENGLQKVALAIGPEFGSVDDDFIRDAARVAKKFASLLIVAATSFDGSAHAEHSIENLRILKTKINPDLSMGELLKKTGNGNLFITFGEPAVAVEESKDGIRVEIKGVDVYDPVKGEIRSSGGKELDYDVAAWFIDTNYNGQAFFVNHAYFLGDNPYEKLKKALKAEIEAEVWDELCTATSRVFAKPKTGKIAVKVINHYGDEVMKIIEIR